MTHSAQSTAESAVDDGALGGPPPVPSSHMDGRRLRDVHLLLWVHTGSAQVEMAPGHTHQLSAGEGIWIPAGRSRHIRTDADSVAFPYELPPKAVPQAPAEPVLFAVPDGWRDWLILQYTHQVAPITSFGYSQAALLDVLGTAGARTTAPTPPSANTTEPPLPTAPGAHAVAEQLRMNPGVGRSVEEWATLTACSPSTLRRGFLDTGMTFAQWRTLTRLAAACEFLDAGYRIEDVARLVGFSSRNGFTRAFRDHHGITPRDYAGLATRSSDAPSERVTAERGSGTLTHLVGQPVGLPAEPARAKPVPSARTKPHTNDVHVLVWTCRGESYLHVGDTHYPRRRGDAIWIPAGIEHKAGNLEDSISLPIGDLLPSDMQITEPIRTHFPRSWDTYLMHRSISARTALRPEGFDYRSILELFHEQFAIQRSRTVPMPQDSRARAVATTFLRQMRTASEAELDPAIHESFLRETGMTFARWRNAARMRVASDLLAEGAKPSAVARRVGYTHLRNFTRAFHTFHGMSPSEYRRSTSGERH